MTREEAIEWLEHISNRYIRGGDEFFDAKRKEAIKMAISALRAQQTPLDRSRWEAHTVAPPPNDPLTLEQLREMDKPVWVECGVTPFTPNGGYYCLCKFGKITVPSGAQFDIEKIQHWKFYRRKLEEGNDEA